MARSKHIPRVFVDTELKIGQTVALPENKCHHLVTVLRAVMDEPIILFNGDGHEYTARLTHAGRKDCQAIVEQQTSPGRESPLHITLLQAIARGDRMDFALAKAVELGVNAIQPVFAQRGQVKLSSQRLAKKQGHWQRTVESAAEQSGRLLCPTVYPATNLQTQLRTPPEADCHLMLAPGARYGLANLPTAQRIALLIGPESGLSQAEIGQAHELGWQAMALGPRVLRTETAGMAALAALQTLWGDFLT